MEHTFKTIQISEPEKIWLNAIYNNLNENTDLIDIKVKLHDLLPKDFNYKSIDQRLCYENHLTLIGIWHIDDKTPIFNNITNIILDIKKLILENSKTDQITAKDIANRIGIDEHNVEKGLYLMSDMGRFWSSAGGSGNGFSSISIRQDYIYDTYLNFDNIEDLMENFYITSLSAPLSMPKAFIPWSQYGSIEPLEEKINYSPQYKPNTAFIIMPIDDENHPEFVDIYDAIVAVCDEFNIKALRSDKIPHQDKIMDIVIKEIRESEFLIADLTLNRPNVYYEIGYAHGIDKRPIMVHKIDTEIHFDLTGYNVLKYKNAHELKDELRENINVLTQKKPKK
ncbi:MAG: hypothetical protein M1273_08335 [Deltaproteobacteria bacterium]|jgi:hypothetical protein|nr:hypothetical protein [Deltaproteobacteria bacterium]